MIRFLRFLRFLKFLKFRKFGRRILKEAWPKLCMLPMDIAQPG